MGTNITNKLASIKSRVPPAKKVASKIEVSKRKLADAISAKAKEELRGPRGFKGEMGPMGPRGLKGDKGDKGDTPILGIDYVVIHGKDGRDGSSLDFNKYIPYIGAIADVDLGNYELYSDGIHVDGATDDPPTGPGLTLAYFEDFFIGDGGSFIASMDWDTWTPLPLLIEASDIYIVGNDIGLEGEDIYVDGNTFTISGQLTVEDGYIGNVIVVDDTYVVSSTDYTVVCNKVTDFTVTLPVGVIGQIFTIKNINIGIVTVDTNLGGDTIDGEAIQTLNQWDAMKVQCYDDNKWVII